MHRREEKKPTATGPLALAALANSELRVHGYQDQPLDFSDLHIPDRRTLLLYPGEDAPVLTTTLITRDERPINLVVPDGSWRQAAKMGKRLPGLEHAEMVRLPQGQVTQWGIRQENHPQGLATFEAIARALGILESTAVQEGMEALFQLMVKRTLLSRGLL
jgi:DTW domain-containing protein YfiP